MEKVLTHLEKYQQPAGEFSPAEFAKFLPSELHISFDTAYLSPISELDELQFEKELVKCARQVRTSTIKKKLNQLQTQLAQAEKEKDSEKVTQYEEEFNKMTKLLSS